MKALAAALIALQGLVAVGLLAVSVHAPSGLALAAPVYFFVAAGLTWWARRRAATVLLAGAAGLALAPATYLFLDWVDRVVYDKRIAGTTVREVRDEAILSSAGRPIGIRVSFSVMLPATGYFGVSPSLMVRDPAVERIIFHTAAQWLDGSRAPRRFEAGRTHQVAAELYPSLLFIRPDGTRCLAHEPLAGLPPSRPPLPLRLMISETSYGMPWRGGKDELTRAAYDPAAMYAAIVAEGLPRCAP